MNLDASSTSHPGAPRTERHVRAVRPGQASFFYYDPSRSPFRFSPSGSACGAWRCR